VAPAGFNNSTRLGARRGSPFHQPGRGGGPERWTVHPSTRRCQSTDSKALRPDQC